MLFSIAEQDTSNNYLVRPQCEASTPALSAFLWASVPTASSFISDWGITKSQKTSRHTISSQSDPASQGCLVSIVRFLHISDPKVGYQPACKYPSVGSLTPHHTPLSHRVDLLLPVLAAGFIAPFLGSPCPTSSGPLSCFLGKLQVPPPRSLC